MTIYIAFDPSGTPHKIKATKPQWFAFCSGFVLGFHDSFEAADAMADEYEGGGVVPATLAYQAKIGGKWVASIPGHTATGATKGAAIDNLFHALLDEAKR